MPFLVKFIKYSSLAILMFFCISDELQQQGDRGRKNVTGFKKANVGSTKAKFKSEPFNKKTQPSQDKS